MTPRVWIERPIATAEDAEALPEGTPAIAEHDFVRERCIGGWTGGEGERLYSHADMTGFTALVPVEAVEQVGRRWDPGDQPEGAEDTQMFPGDPLPDWIDAIPTQRRLVTEWEDA